MLGTFVKLVAGAVVVYVAVVALLWLAQERLAFPAPRSGLPDPASRGMPDGRLVAATTADGVTLRGWYLPPAPPPPPGGRAPGLIWFPGNAETIAHLAPFVRDLRPAGTGVLILDYRGYGTSDGRASETGIYRDADAAWEHLAAQPEIDPARIAVYGRSVGSAPALHLAVTKPARAVVLEAPFTSAREMARAHYPFVPQFLVRLGLDNLARARQLTAPLLVLHGTADGIVPFAMGRRVAEAGRAGELVVVDGAGHNDLYALAGPRYREKVQAFLAAELAP